MHHAQKHVGQVLLASGLADFAERAVVDQLSLMKQSETIADAFGFIQAVRA